MPGEGGYVRKVSRSVPGVTTTSLRQAVAGTYQCEQITGDALDWTTATEYEVAAVATNILANTESKDEVYSWVKANIVFWNTANAEVYEWFLLRVLISDADPDLDSEAIVEALQKDKRILKRGWGMHGILTGGKPFSKIDFEIYQLRLRYGEELRLLILPYTTAGNTIYMKGRLEWRQQGK